MKCSVERRKEIRTTEAHLGVVRQTCQDLRILDLASLSFVAVFLVARVIRWLLNYLHASDFRTESTLSYERLDTAVKRYAISY